nr:hypothetical protein [Amycolatopsis deserti]
MTRRSTPFTAPAEGVWTEEVGTITGALELRTTCDGNGDLVAHVRYSGALDWYTVRGGRARLHDVRDHDPVHTLLVNVLRR